ncbi:phospholipase A2, minor isoenzyme [Latimeria chalumnae]|uniref:Phospholipase A2 n=1 Tax=Latimeria chalumnae TaxID=7897 RepID=M3XIZ3_LATCH|nr:PREDICTED: phospholipase A2 [Latimeria chalumnae]|eukprot:XP_014345137.1 PREDICTED: phospholipase A2 [Latimeria chalumnae]
MRLNLITLAFLFTVGAVEASDNPRAVWQFRKMILCTLPNSDPVKDFNDYGCYCGIGGSGTPVDEVDRCCETHDRCYRTAKKMKECNRILDNPYTELYSYKCSGNKITCSSKNNACEKFICECDRRGAMCFATAQYNDKYKDLNTSKYCK